LQKELIKIAHALSLKKTSDIISGYLRYVDLYLSLGIYLIVPFAVEDILAKRVKNKLQEKFGVLSNKYYEIITRPTELIEYQRFRLELLQDFIDDNFENKMDEYLDKYAWLAMYTYTDEPVGEEYLRDQIVDLSKAQALKEIQKTNSIISENSVKYQDVLLMK
jgi:hypothetical protein